MKNIKTQSQTSEGYQPSMFNSNNHSPVAIGIALARGVSLLCSQKQFSIVFTPQSYGSNEPQNDEGGEVVNICHTEERSDVSIHRMGTQSQNSEDNTHF